MLVILLARVDRLFVRAWSTGNGSGSRAIHGNAAIIYSTASGSKGTTLVGSLSNGSTARIVGGANISISNSSSTALLRGTIRTHTSHHVVVTAYGGLVNSSNSGVAAFDVLGKGSGSTDTSLIGFATHTVDIVLDSTVAKRFSGGLIAYWIVVGGIGNGWVRDLYAVPVYIALLIGSTAFGSSSGDCSATHAV